MDGNKEAVKASLALLKKKMKADADAAGMPTASLTYCSSSSTSSLTKNSAPAIASSGLFNANISDHRKSNNNSNSNSSSSSSSSDVFDSRRKVAGDAIAPSSSSSSSSPLSLLPLRSAQKDDIIRNVRSLSIASAHSSENKCNSDSKELKEVAISNKNDTDTNNHFDTSNSVEQSPSSNIPQPCWSCNECKNECIPITRESRCLCGHRLKEHKFTSNSSSSSSGGGSSSGGERYSCCSSKCKCRNFFYVVAEGAWCIRCRCKHKHTEHDCSSAPYKCQKCSSCNCFDSPWVCNCGHSWSAHTQGLRSRGQPTALAHIMTAATVAGSGGDEEAILKPVARKNFAVRQDGLLSHLNDDH